MMSSGRIRLGRAARPRRFGIRISLGALFMFAIQAAAAGPPTPRNLLTAEQAIDEAIAHNLGLLAERVNLSLAEAALITARLRPNPVFTASADHLDLLGTGFSALNNGGPPELAWRVDVPFERGHKRELRIESASFARQIAEARLLDAVRRLKLDVGQACIDVIAARANLTLQRDNLRTLEELVGLNDVRVQTGSIAPVELTRARVAMLQFRGGVKRAELDLVTARSKLQNLLGRSVPTDDFDVAGDLTVPPSLPAPEFDSLRAAALAARPDVVVVERTQARSQSELKLQLAQAKVDYLYGAEYRRQQGVSGKSNSLGVFFSVPLPLFNRNQGEIARVRAEQQQLGRQLEAIQAQVSTEVKTAVQEFRAARDLVESIERDLLHPAAEARDTVQYVYRTGAATLVEFLDAQRAYNETSQSYNEARAALRRAILRLNAAVGTEVSTS
jgi:cobalt-zinc-cadmium efflux system outer membrane protein